MTFKRRRSGYLIDRADPKDYDVDEMIMRYGAPNNGASSADLSDAIVSVLDQGNVGSCVLNVLTQAIRATSWRAIGLDQEPPPLGDRLHSYRLARRYSQNEASDTGTTYRAAFEALEAFGIAKEESYDESRVLLAPPPRYLRQAFDVRTAAKRKNRAFWTHGADAPAQPWYRLYGPARVWPDKVRALLSRKILVCGGFAVDDRFADNAFDPDEAWKGMRDVSQAGPLNHALLITGFEGRRFRVLNSWGTEWGDQGYCWFDEDYLTSNVTTHVLAAIEHAPILR